MLQIWIVTDGFILAQMIPPTLWAIKYIGRVSYTLVKWWPCLGKSAENSCFASYGSQKHEQKLSNFFDALIRSLHGPKIRDLRFVAPREDTCCWNSR